MKLAKQLTDLIGNTPLLQLNHINPAIWAKLESFNPQGSVKDRAAYYMVKDGIEKGLISDGTVIVESTSGNTGIALAYICTCLGLRLIITMPESMSVERRNLLAALGAELVLTPAAEGMRGAIKKAREICEKEKGYMVGQFENPANAQAHRETTAVEIMRDLVDDVDIFVAGVGTGGTITGCAEAFKEKLSDVKIVAVEPAESPVLSGGKAAAHKIQGIGAGFVPKILKRELIDEVIQITACRKGRRAMRRIIGRGAGGSDKACREAGKRRQKDCGRSSGHWGTLSFHGPVCRRMIPALT